ncbi:MHO_1580 family protein [Metamycoplasma canadense]|nr:hypothetical protein [Metamycoplasma canadense]
MFAVYNQNLNKTDLVEKRNIWTEEFLINAKRNKYLENWLSTNELTKLKIKRIIQSDKFIIFFEHYNALKEIEDIKITGLINNNKMDFKPIYDINSGKFIFSYNSDLDIKNSLDFKDIININFEIEYKVNGLWYQTKSFTYWIKRNQKSKNLLINKETNIEILSEIEIVSLPDRIDKNIINHDFKTKYITLIFKPNNLKQGFHNQKLYDLKILKLDKNTNDEYLISNSDVYNLSFSPASIFGSTKDKYEVKLNYKSFNDCELVVDSYSYYDKYVDSVVVNAQHLNAKLGLLIPLKYSGIFGHEINLDIGKNLKNFKLSYAQDIKKPFFDINNGLIKIKTKSINGWLTDEKYYKIKYKNFVDIINNANSLEYIKNTGVK